MEYYIVLENSLGCELDHRVCESDEIALAVMSLAKYTIFAEGDVIRVKERN